ncbi:hypothetical protein P43SY_004641 [Pythium insidiosum]|uniref:F-box domain-containing protein n=1 Tax=Pythium insidiosum TaxID=114742 RepID=A0AAD5Q7B3_PYTIN|nr:hypothetical protein P43SY_004641 [Pythium insidiosum]
MTIADESKPRAHVSKKRLWWDETAMAVGSAILPPPASKPRAPRGAATDALPLEVLAVVLSYLDGHSLLRSSAVCRAWARVSHDRDTWRNICLHSWPTLRTQVLPQLPGAPDYDIIRLYGGSWRRCFVERHASNQRAEIRVAIPNFPRATDGKVVSETFSIGDHRFCLWIFPSGNPHEPLYKDKVLSVYLVLTDLDRRPSDWVTSAVFSLSVVNHIDSTRRIEWHSCLADNKFDSNVTNWGVHSLGSLKTLHNPANGFLVNDTLTVSASVRLMSITFRLIMEQDLKAHHHLGLADLANVHTITMPFCASLEDLLQRLRREYHMDTAHAISQQLRCDVSELMLFKEEIAPTLISGPLIWSDETPTDTSLLQSTDIVIAVGVNMVANGTFEHVMKSLLWSHYKVAAELANREFTDVTLEHIESMAERLDIPKFRAEIRFSVPS